MNLQWLGWARPVAAEGTSRQTIGAVCAESRAGWWPSSLWITPEVCRSFSSQPEDASTNPSTALRETRTGLCSPWCSMEIVSQPDPCPSSCWEPRNKKDISHHGKKYVSMLQHREACAMSCFGDEFVHLLYCHRARNPCTLHSPSERSCGRGPFLLPFLQPLHKLRGVSTELGCCYMLLLHLAVWSQAPNLTSWLALRCITWWKTLHSSRNSIVTCLLRNLEEMLSGKKKTTHGYLYTNTQIPVIWTSWYENYWRKINTPVLFHCASPLHFPASCSAFITLLGHFLISSIFPLPIFIGF